MLPCLLLLRPGTAKIKKCIRLSGCQMFCHLSRRLNYQRKKAKKNQIWNYRSQILVITGLLVFGRVRNREWHGILLSVLIHFRSKREIKRTRRGCLLKLFSWIRKFTALPSWWKRCRSRRFMQGSRLCHRYLIRRMRIFRRLFRRKRLR